jgi:hypothetical protein
MNRHQRRAAGAQARKRKGARHSSFYQEYVRHLPQEPIDASTEDGRVYHLVHQHDDWCRFYETDNPVGCNCNVVVTRHVEPSRS